MENETKAKEFTTAKGRFLVLEGQSGDMLNIREKQYPDTKLIGLARLLDEEQWAEIVDTPEEDRTGYEPGVFGYKTSIHGNFSIFSYTQLGQSLMQSIGCPIVNPLGEEPPVVRGYTSNMNFSDSLEEWQAAEKEIKNYLILKIKE